MPPKSAIRQILKNIRERLLDKSYSVVYDQDNTAYFKHRAIEAIMMGDYYLACQLLIILLIKETT